MADFAWGQFAAGRVRDDYDRTRQYEADEEPSLWDEAQDEALRSAAERFNDHTEDVP